MLRRSGSGDGGATLVQTGQTRRAHQAVADDIVWHVTGWIARFAVAALVLVLARISVDRAVPSELSHVVAAQNRFMSRLSTNIGAPRAFIAEAAHQIPNPLASLCAQAQTATDSRSALPTPTPDTVKRVVEPHGGRLELARSRCGGLEARLRLSKDAA
ncbi:hypothetical protein SAMN04487939_10614 [Lysobacter sp. yr284]|uniref:hypothetical protein n=1 Tax=Lysobacter sp. yr284 TaxID=1761791 RepID=UPI000899B0E3|nr:hypothetical protein [Lysobacter sp. yr284]SDY77467.1 hypothetical protein SAMN04487939_10614 [Lysobacter sp. yr284]